MKKSLLFCLILIFIIGCAGKPVKRESLLDTPEYHYNLGSRYLEDGEYQKAALEFERAKALDPKFCLAYTGLAIVKAKQKDFKKAISFAKKGKSLAETKREKLESYVSMGRVLSLRRKGNWLKKANKEFKKALKLDPKFSKAYYYRGLAYKRGYKFKEAGDDFRKVLELNTTYIKKADHQWSIIQKIERAAPGTLVGKKIALLEEIDRSDVAALFVAELNLDRYLKKRMPLKIDISFKTPEAEAFQKEDLPIIKDIQDHWARNYIEEVVKYGIIPLFPDNTFKPDRLITKANFSKMLLDLIVVITGDTTLETKYFGAVSPFKDVRSDHFAFPAIMVTTTRGILEARDKIKGIFGLMDKVSGPEALLAIRNLKIAMQW
jgi:Tfp pilus assembly protein PilF